TVTDNNATISGGTIATLAVGATDAITFSGSHIITQEDINTGYVYNLATATGKDPKGNPVTDTSSDPTPCTSCPVNPECTDCTITPLVKILKTQTPSIDVIKIATSTSFNKVGDIVNYVITVKNTGNVILSNVNITDPLTGFSTIIENLNVGKILEYNQSYTIKQLDLDKGSVLNIASASGKDPKGNTISDEDSEIVNEKANTIDAIDDNIGTVVGVNQITPNVINVFTNDTLNTTAVNPSEVILTAVTSNPFLIMNPDGSIDVLPNAPVGTLTLTYQICEKLNTSNCDTAVVTVIIEAPSMTVSGESICVNDVPYFKYTTTANNFTPVNGLTITWKDSNNNIVSTMTNLPLNGQVLWPGAVIDANGNGTDWPGWILVNGKWMESSDGFENLRPTAIVALTLNPTETIVVSYPPSIPFCTSRPIFTIDAVNDTAETLDGFGGATNVVNVFTNDTLNTVTLNPNDVNLTLTIPDPTGSLVLNPDGSVDVNPNTPTGTYILTYQICEKADEGNCDTAVVTVNVEFSLPPAPPVPVFAQDDTAGPIDGANGKTNILNVLTNDFLGLASATLNNVSLSLVTPDPTGYMTMNTDGSIDIKDGTPAGTYILTYQICEKDKPSNCDTAIVTITVICRDQTKIAGIVINEGTKKPLANVPVTLIPQGTTTGSVQIRITNAEGYYNFTGMVPGDYLVQVQDANLNAAYQLYPTSSSLFFTTLENCKYQAHNFGFDKSNLPVLGDFVWYDVNNNGLQDEWFDANNDNVVTKNVPDANGSFDYSKWEWIDLNGDDSYKGILNVGELNAAGFGNAKSANVFVTGPSNYSDSVIVGIQGFWRNRPTAGVFGEYKVELKMDSNLEAQSSAMGATGLVKVLPNTDRKIPESKTTAFEVCGPTNNTVQTANLTSTNQVNLDLDFGISCKLFANIQASNDTYNVTQCSIANEIRNALANDLLNGSPADIAKFKFKLLTALSQFIIIDDNGNITLTDDAKAGIFKFEYQVCEAANPTNCSTATITINITGIEPVTINSTACNADTSPLDLNSLLPAGIPTDGTWIDTDNTGGLNGSILNTFGIPTNKYNYEYKIGGLCPRSIFLILDVNFDCKVLGCGTIIVHNAFSPNGDGLNDIFKIDSIDDTICYPENTIEIYNRWGVLVFETKNYNNTSNYFDGVSRGRTTVSQSSGLPNGTYFYILNYTSFDLNGNPVQNKKDGYLYLSK
uniref:T9SS C-terminal target domain-containing protein n=1 Tax=Flavobacterium succinicans TaxID=29536 RepID=UPI000557686A